MLYMKHICGATCSDNYDFVFSDDGMLSVETKTHSTLANILKLDFNSNDDWILDRDLGLDWINKNNDGLLQVKGSEAQMVSAIQRKLLKTEGVREVKEIEIKRGLNRKLYLKVVVIATTGVPIILERKV